LLKQHVVNTQNEILTSTNTIIPQIIDGLVKDDIKRLREAQAHLDETRSLWKRYRRKEILGMRKIDALMAVEKNTWFHLGCNNISQMLYGLKRMLEPIIEHVDNNFNPMPAEYVEELLPIAEEIQKYVRQVQGLIVSGDFSRFDEAVVDGNALKARVQTMRHKLQEQIQHEDANLKIALLYLNTLQEIQELSSMLRHLIRAAKRFQE
jgi:hypothetical protein